MERVGDLRNNSGGLEEAFAVDARAKAAAQSLVSRPRARAPAESEL
jgi:hypothetical protein